MLNKNSIKFFLGDCFKYAVICGLYHSDVQLEGQKTTLKSSYANYIDNVNFSGLQFPFKVKESNFKIFEENNKDLALNIIALKVPTRRVKKQRDKTKRKALDFTTYRTSKFTRERFNIFLLLLYHPQSKQAHFATITKLNSFLANARSSTKVNNKTIFCFTCKTRFCGKNQQRNYNLHHPFCGKRVFSSHFTRSLGYKNLPAEDDKQKSVCQNCFGVYEGSTKELRENYLLQHQKHCLKHPPTFIKMPSDSTLCFNNYHKQREAPFVIYADTESVLVNDKGKQLIDRKIKRIRNKKYSRGKSRKREAAEENLRLDMFLNEESDEDNDSVQERERNYNVEIDDQVPSSTTNNPQTLDQNHEISGFSFKVVTLKHLQHHFQKLITYSGIDAGKIIVSILYNLNISVSKVSSFLRN